MFHLIPQGPENKGVSNLQLVKTIDYKQNTQIVVKNQKLIFEME